MVAALGVFGVLILAEDDPPAIAEDLPAGCQPGVPYVTCTYTSSTKLSFDQMRSQVEAAVGRQFDASTPVWLQAWGGRGARGSSYTAITKAVGGYGGYAGYATTVSSVGRLSGNDLYLYVGASGSKHANYSGQGGASTAISTQTISTLSGFPSGLLVLAGGSGGGGKATCSGGENGGRGGAGGVYIPGHVVNNGGGGNGEFGAGNGEGGSSGKGGAGAGGSAYDGTGGVGGSGGAGDADGSPTGWINVDAIDPNASKLSTGNGGKGGGGGGGGGYGGGGGASGCSGGGGAGSYAVQNAVDDRYAPTDSKQGDGAQSKIILTFNFS